MVSLIEAWVEHLGEMQVSLLSGLFCGFLFGFMAQRSRFCLRAAVVEFVTGHFGEKLAIWLLTFGVAITLVQVLIGDGGLDVSNTRALGATGSLSGALVGGAMFGCGMILARGCASRLLVLSATGNLRALIAGLVFVVTAQAAFQGMLEPLRLFFNNLWTIEGGAARDIVKFLGGTDADKVPIALIWLGAAILFAIRGRVPFWGWVGGIGTGLAVALAYYLTYQISVAAMSGGAAKGITFSGPSAEALMRVLTTLEKPPGFDAMLVPGVFLGAAIGALLYGEWRIQVFDANSGTIRYMVGAVLMGFGAMLAGGCAVGAGVSGGAIFAITAWLALIGMWAGAGAMHWIMDEKRDAEPKTALKSAVMRERARMASTPIQAP